jgi:hypothetical protein
MEQGQAYWFSVPARVIGKRTLDHIPYEIYLEIFSYLEPSHELGTEESQLILSNMARVCRLFYDIAVPSLYRSICLTGSLEEFEEKTPRALTRFCVMLKKEEAPVIARSNRQYRRRCSIYIFSLPGGCQTSKLLSFKMSC